MPKTIRLLATHAGHSPGTILTLPDAEADQLLRGNATLDLTGGRYPIESAPRPTPVQTEVITAVPQFYDPSTAHIPTGRRRPGFKKKPGAMVLSGRNKSLAPFPFQAVYAGALGGNQAYMPETINSTYADGIPGVLEWVNDSAALTNSSASEVPSDELGAWLLRCQPTHQVFGGRPRMVIAGYPVRYYKRHRVGIKLRMHHPAGSGGLGYFNNTAAMPHAAVWALSQLSGAAPFDFAEGQLGQGASPLYIKQQGAGLFVEIHTISNGMGQFPGDSGSGLTVSYPRWNVGDTQLTVRTSSIKTMRGRRYHQIAIEFFLDERREGEGCEGYFVGYFDGEPWFRYDGPTSLPRNARGHLVPISPRLGYYEVTSGAQPVGTVNNTVDAPNGATSVERSWLVADYFCLPEDE